MKSETSRKKPKNDYSALEKEYALIAPTAENFASELSRQLEKLLGEEKIPLGLPIQVRVKSWDSLRGKLERRSLTVSSVKDLTDLIGMRIIVLFRRDLDRVTRILDENFTVVRREDTASRLTESQFGYQSIHYVVELPERWFALPTLKGMAGLQAEVQIRTVSQHIWAASSHVLQYKHETSVPPALRRTIHRASALLETVDLEFERVLEENERYAAAVTISAPDQELNVITLHKVLADVLPRENTDPTDHEDYAELLEQLRKAGVKTSGELRKMLVASLPTVLNLDKKIAEALAAAGEGYVIVDKETYGGTDRDRYKRGVFWTHVGMAREALEQRGKDEKRREHVRDRSL